MKINTISLRKMMLIAVTALLLLFMLAKPMTTLAANSGCPTTSTKKMTLTYGGGGSKKVKVDITSYLSNLKKNGYTVKKINVASSNKSIVKTIKKSKNNIYLLTCRKQGKTTITFSFKVTKGQKTKKIKRRFVLTTAKYQNPIESLKVGNWTCADTVSLNLDQRIPRALLNGNNLDLKLKNNWKVYSFVSYDKTDRKTKTKSLAPTLDTECHYEIVVRNSKTAAKETITINFEGKSEAEQADDNRKDIKSYTYLFYENGTPLKVGVLSDGYSLVDFDGFKLEGIAENAYRLADGISIVYTTDPTGKNSAAKAEENRKNIKSYTYLFEENGTPLKVGVLNNGYSLVDLNGFNIEGIAENAYRLVDGRIVYITDPTGKNSAEKAAENKKNIKSYTYLYYENGTALKVGVLNNGYSLVDLDGFNIEGIAENAYRLIDGTIVYTTNPTK